MRHALVFIAALTIATAAAAANVVFVTPLQGGQAVGPQWIEITTDATRVDRVEFYVDGVLAGVARTAPWRIAHDFGTTLTSREITAKVFSNGYRNTDVARIATAALTAGESIDVDLVEVPLRVRSSHALRASDLRVRENSVEQSVREIKPGRGPAHFAFVVDRSLSMGDGKLAAALAAVDEGLKLLRPDDSASLILFNHNVSRARELGNGASAISALGETVASGGTSLRDAVASTAQSGDGGRRTYAIVLTDGGDRNSELSDEAALRKISGAKSIVAAIVFGSPGEFLTRAARNTGGDLVRATRETASRRLRDVLTGINSRYTLVYQSHGTAKGWRTISVSPRVRGIEIVSSRKGYFAG